MSGFGIITICLRCSNAGSLKHSLIFQKETLNLEAVFGSLFARGSQILSNEDGVFHSNLNLGGRAQGEWDRFYVVK